MRLVLLAGLMVATSAAAEPAKPADPLRTPLATGQARALLMSPIPQAPAPLAYARRAPAALPEGVVRTSVETRLAGRDDAVGEAGFLCGLMPHADTSGAADAYGHDPDGRFVGAKLRMSF